MPKAVIEVDRNGVVSINYDGFQGKACDLAENTLLQKFMKALNITKTKEDRKDQLVGEMLHV